MKTRSIVTAALLTAAGVAVSYLKIPLLPAAPFLEYTPADIPTLLGSFALGPILGALIGLLRAIIHNITIGSGGPVGFIMDALTATLMAATAGSVYYLRKTRVGAVLALLAGSIVMTVIATVINYFWAYPAFGAPPSAVWTTALPFNLIKCTINSLIVFLIYKPLSPILHGKKR